MLIGQHKHTLDTKKRLSLPAKFRKELGKTVVITKGLDSVIFLYSQKEWKKFSENVSDLSMGQSDTRAFSRHFLGGASEVDIDSAGRILIPDFLKDLAQLDSKVMVVGMVSRIELWDEERWNKSQADFNQKADIVAEKLGEIGVI